MPDLTTMFLPVSEPRPIRYHYWRAVALEQMAQNDQLYIANQTLFNAPLFPQPAMRTPQHAIDRSRSFAVNHLPIDVAQATAPAWEAQAPVPFRFVTTPLYMSAVYGRDLEPTPHPRNDASQFERPPNVVTGLFAGYAVSALGSPTGDPTTAPALIAIEQQPLSRVEFPRPRPDVPPGQLPLMNVADYNQAAEAWQSRQEIPVRQVYPTITGWQKTGSELPFQTAAALDWNVQSQPPFLRQTFPTQHAATVSSLIEVTRAEDAFASGTLPAPALPTLRLAPQPLGFASFHPVPITFAEQVQAEYAQPPAPLRAPLPAEWWPDDFYPPWQESGVVIFVAGPYCVIAMDVSFAGAIQGDVQCH